MSKFEDCCQIGASFLQTGYNICSRKDKKSRVSMSAEQRKHKHHRDASQHGLETVPPKTAINYREFWTQLRPSHKLTFPLIYFTLHAALARPPAL